MAKSLKLLQEFKSLTVQMLDRLNQQGVNSVAHLVSLNSSEIKALLSVSDSRSERILSEAKANLPPFIVYSGTEMLEKQTTKNYLSSGCIELDGLLGGRGFEPGVISEVAAPFGAGKSQLAFTLAVLVQKPIEEGGLDGSVIWIDTESTFSSKRIVEIAEARKMDPEQVLKNVKVIKPRNSQQQIVVMSKLLEQQDKLGSILGPLDKPIRLVIVDSITAHFRSQYVGRGTLAQRQQKLSRHIRDCHQFARQRSCVVLFTNQVMSSPDPFTETYTPIGGNVLGHAATYRLVLRKYKVKRIAELIDSSHLPNGQAKFRITSILH